MNVDLKTYSRPYYNDDMTMIWQWYDGDMTMIWRWSIMVQCF